MDGEGVFVFDDDIFDTDDVTNNKCSQNGEPHPIDFQPRTPKWFMYSPMPSDKDNLGMSTKFKADLAYAEMRYEDAIIHLKYFQDNIKDTNHLLWRSSEEDLGRCYLKLNQVENSLCCANNLQSTASNLDHFTCSTNLFIDIYNNADITNHDTVIQLKRLLLIHPGHSSAWFKLGGCCLKVFGVDSKEVFPHDLNILDCHKRQVIISFAICYLLEKRKSCQSFAIEVSRKNLEKAHSILQIFYKDEESLNLLLESIKSKYTALLEHDKHGLVSIEYCSSHNYLEVLRDATNLERHFDEKWFNI